MIVSVSAAYADDAAELTSLSLRLSYDADSCPTRVGVYLDQTADTISGFELVLLWDRPDALRFRLSQTTVPGARGERDTLPSDTVVAPVLLSDSGLIRNWTYLEARGRQGYMARITGLAQLLDPNPASRILPGDHGLLFELLVEIVSNRSAIVDGDSLTLGIQPQVSRLSNGAGELIDTVHMEPLRIPIPECRTSD
ncbi:MAG: hypothetical protein GF341_10190 [candidate division Zixibacteria bacterium]|nr:hypothetical protein [candidate division Zixibacteria bacterium]